MQTPPTQNGPVRRVVRKASPPELPNVQAAQEMIQNRKFKSAKPLPDNTNFRRLDKNNPTNPEIQQKFAEMQALFRAHGQELKIVTSNSGENNVEMELPVNMAAAPENNMQPLPPIESFRRQKAQSSNNNPAPNAAVSVNHPYILEISKPQSTIFDNTNNTFEPVKELNTNTGLRPSLSDLNNPRFTATPPSYIPNNESITKIANITKPEVKPAFIHPNISRVANPLPSGSKSTRIIFPSNNIFYNSIDIGVRTFDIPDIVNLKMAAEENDESALIDVLDQTLINFDVRDLTLPDFHYLLFWHKLNSFVKTPYKFSYDTFYGNTGEYTVKQTNLKVIQLEASVEEWQEACNLGLALPTIRDQEEFNLIKSRLDKKQIFLYEKAQYLQGDSVLEKINNLQSNWSVDDMYSTIPNFVKRFDSYGVVEEFEIQDEKFEPNTAIAYLQKKVEGIRALLDSDEAKTTEMYQILSNLASEFNFEILRIQEELANTGEAAPKRETKQFSLSIADFFPLGA